MIFKRRERPGIAARAREFLSPRKGFWRGWGYISKRLRRLPDSPHKIALGFGCGAFASFTPFFGFHFFVAAGLAWLVRGNFLSALFGTVVGNPITFPLISATSLYVGRLILGRGGSGSESDTIMAAFGDFFSSIWISVKSWFGYGPSMWDGVLIFLDEVFLPYLIGGLLPGAVAGVAFYWIIGPIVAAYQERRRKLLETVRARHAAKAVAEQDAYRTREGEAGDNA